jgi:hypothetical protein
MNVLDLALNGALGASPDSDTRDPLAVASLVCAELANGSDITDACAAAVVAPSRYLASVEDSAVIRELHERALRIRARVLADAPLALARVLAERREGRGASLGVSLGELAKAVMAEAVLTARGTASGDNVTERAPTIIVRFDTLPAHAPIADASIEYVSPTLSDALAPGDSALSDDVAYAYDETTDELDAPM